MTMWKITTLEELGGVAHTVLAECVLHDRATVLALKGDLGAGKTAFVKEIGKLVGIPHEITSPTFVIMKSYEIPAHLFLKTLVHIDAYRIEDEDEMRVLKFDEIISNPTKLVCIEWPEKIQNLISVDAKTIEFILNQDGTREIVRK